MTNENLHPIFREILAPSTANGMDTKNPLAQALLSAESAAYAVQNVRHTLKQLQHTLDNLCEVIDGLITANDEGTS
jgi:hypothetical protein